MTASSIATRAFFVLAAASIVITASGQFEEASAKTSKASPTARHGSGQAHYRAPRAQLRPSASPIFIQQNIQTGRRSASESGAGGG